MHSTSLIRLAVIAIALILAAALLYSFLRTDESVQAVTTFEECAAAGYPIMESYPEQCRTPDGKNFVRDIPPSDGLGLQANGCAVAGCSGQLCVSAAEAGNIITTCEFRAEYACYKEAYCGPQADGKCGWSQTPELQRCLANPPAIDASLEVY